MRTKTLLLTAALSAAGIATSMAQVYSVNAVGYVNTDIVKGFNLISNPLTAADMSINALFKNTTPSIPAGFAVYKFENGAFATAQYDDLDQNFGANGTKTVKPGEGVFVFNPGNTTLKVTFVGEVPQGTLSHPTPKGFSIQSSEVPQADTASALGLTGAAGDAIYMFNEATQSYSTHQYDDLDLAFQNLPQLGVGEAFFLFRATTANPNWTRTFSVNQ